MQHQVNLLVCLNPSVPHITITEHTFRAIINPLAPIMDAKVICKEGLIKAFVRVENKDLAVLVIEKFHGKIFNVGKIKVFESHKNFIRYHDEKDDSELDIKLLCEDTFEVDSKSRNKNNPDKKYNNFYKQIKKEDKTNNYTEIETFCMNDLAFNSGAQNSNPKPSSKEVLGCYHHQETSDTTNTNLLNFNILENNANNVDDEINITHKDKRFMRGSKVSKMFRKIGRILSIHYNDTEAFWTIRYRSKKKFIE